ncbi:MAG: hypothetical protein V1874_10150 [Spirochaetota bacterium]
MFNANAPAAIFNKIAFLSIILTFILLISPNLFAIEVKRTEIIGSTIDLEIKQYISNIKGGLSKTDIESIGVKVTDEYHEKGYTTSYVEKLVMRDDGVLEIHVKESRILGLNISGIEGKNKDQVEKTFNPFIGSIYNRFEIEKTAETVKYNYSLDTVRIYPVNYGDTSDVFLSIKLNKKEKGNFYGGLGYEPVYGISPYLGYYYPFIDTAADLYAKIGYREGKLRRAEFDVKYFLFPDNDPRGFYIGTNIATFLERWESRDSDYRRSSLSPVLGYRALYKYLFIDLYANEIISDIKDYRTDEKTFRDYDTRITMEINISNKSTLLSRKDASGLKLTASSGKSDLSEKIYVISSGELKTAFTPVTRFRVTPLLYSYYTTMDERYFWQYVYDKRLLGFFDDYTASKWKNTAAMDIEYEIIPQFIYAGPFVNTGYFQDETLEWKSRTGGGARCSIEFKHSYIEINYAWDLSKGPGSGGFALLAGGSF